MNQIVLNISLENLKKKINQNQLLKRIQKRSKKCSKWEGESRDLLAKYEIFVTSRHIVHMKREPYNSRETDYYIFLLCFLISAKN